MHLLSINVLFANQIFTAICWTLFHSLWQGLIAEHAFHGFKTVRAPTDNLAREQLGSKLAGYWDTAKNWKAPDEEYA